MQKEKGRIIVFDQFVMPVFRSDRWNIEKQILLRNRTGII